MFNNKIVTRNTNLPPTNLQSVNNVNKGLKNDKGDSGIKGWMDKQLKAETLAKASQLKSEISSYLFGNISKTVYLTGSEQASNRRGIMKRFDVIAEQLQSAYQSNNNNVLQNRVKNIKQVLLEAVTECINKITTNIKFAAQKHQFDFSLDNKAKVMIKDFIQNPSDTKYKKSDLEKQIEAYLTVGINGQSTKNKNSASLFLRDFQLKQYLGKLPNNDNNEQCKIIVDMIINTYERVAKNCNFYTYTPADDVFDREVILENKMYRYLTGVSTEAIPNQIQALKDNVELLIQEAATVNEFGTAKDIQKDVQKLFDILRDTLREMKGKNKVMPDRFLMVEEIFARELDCAMHNLGAKHYEKYVITSRLNDVSGNKVNNNQNINKVKTEEKEEYNGLFNINKRPKDDVSDNEVSAKISINKNEAELLSINSDFFKVFNKGVKAELNNKEIGDSLAYAVDKSVDALRKLDKLLTSKLKKRDSTKYETIEKFRYDLYRKLQLIDNTLKEFASNIKRTKTVYRGIAKIDNSVFNRNFKKCYAMVASKNIFDLEEKQNAIDLVLSPASLFESVFEVEKSVESLINYHK
ncbi:MAG: hypothetical protein GY730_03625 [bacterium]|nr:hypothetical protein [bacterium]